MTYDKYLSVKQVAERFRVSRHTIYRWKREGDFPKAVKLSAGSVRWRLSDIAEWESGLSLGFATHLTFDMGLAA